MNSSTHHVHRRRRAIERLQTLTSGAALLGVAGTVGFAGLAAATWSGNSGAATAGDLDSGAGGTSAGSEAGSGQGVTGAGNPGAAATPRANIFGSTPNAGTGSQGATRVRPVQPGTGRSHATSGGSH
jgi:hypothetical protein